MTSPTIIVTRSQPGADQTARALEERGLTVIVTPAIELTRSDAALPDLSAYGGLIFTSANGVRFLSAETEARDLPTWCVGPATASEALLEGYSPVHQSSGDAEDLAHYIAHHWPSGQSKRLLHVANSAAKGIVKAALEGEGFEVDFLALYEASYAPGLTPAARAAIESGEPCIVLVHSAKGAKAFMDLSEGLDLSRISYVAISEQAAGPLREGGEDLIDVAEHPDEAHLLETLDRFLATR
ncbi:uroporphyrinogen-III synthase [Henriciella barbarensis]|uniref:Uroporphyrinogen-III synthase n=1 Tax=Henriciella barbarensis TaxID=86342 RepID=A0A399R0Y7_9PROT|nr:uroporphyrinogen-III synthase [Henriciella barbarensis]RIJ23955.1 uroporphyrinogen-III synthase [Henriciella barbarensis]